MQSRLEAIGKAISPTAEPGDARMCSAPAPWAPLVMYDQKLRKVALVIDDERRQPDGQYRANHKDYFELYGDEDWERAPDWAGTHICILVEEESEAAHLKRRHSRLKKRNGGSLAATEKA